MTLSSQRNSKRIPVPTKLVAEVFWSADRACCICNQRKSLLIHHIDRNRSNNSPENLVPLCPNCHSDVHTEGGHGRKYSKDELKKFRDEAFRRVFKRRNEYKRILPNAPLSSLAKFEVRRMSYQIEDNRTNWERLDKLLTELLPYARDFGFSVKVEVVHAVSLACDGAHNGISIEVVRDIQTLILEVLPLGFRGLRRPMERAITKQEKMLAHQAVGIADDLAWEVFRYLRKTDIAQETAFILYAILRFAQLNNIDELESEVLQAFERNIQICNEDRTGTKFLEGREILTKSRADALSEIAK